MQTLLMAIAVVTNFVYSCTLCTVFGLEKKLKNKILFSVIATFGIFLRIILFPYTSTLGYLFFIFSSFISAIICFRPILKRSLFNFVITMNFFLIVIRSLCISVASIITDINPLEMVGEHPLYYVNTNISTLIPCVTFIFLLIFVKPEYFRLIGEKLGGFNSAVLIIIIANFYMILNAETYAFVESFQWFNWYQVLTCSVWLTTVAFMLVILLKTALHDREKMAMEKDMMFKHNSINRTLLLVEINCTKKIITYLHVKPEFLASVKESDTVDFLQSRILELFDEEYTEKYKGFDIIEFSKERAIEEVFDVQDTIRLFYNNTFRWMTFLLSTRVEKSSKDIILVASISDNIHELKEKERKLKEKCAKDSFLNVYNKEATENLINDSLEEFSEGALFLIDIDNFKEINDTFGHSYGDEVLKDVCKKIQTSFRPSDIVGRIGGDEFIVFLQGCNAEDIVLEKAQKLNQLIRCSYEQNSKEVGISASIGIVSYPTNGKSFFELYINADNAMYQVKMSTKNGHKIFLKEGAT